MNLTKFAHIIQTRLDREAIKGVSPLFWEESFKYPMTAMTLSWSPFSGSWVFPFVISHMLYHCVTQKSHWLEPGRYSFMLEGFVYMSMPDRHICAMPTETRRCHWIPGIEVMDSCKQPCGCYKLSPSLLQEQQLSHPSSTLKVICFLKSKLKYRIWNLTSKLFILYYIKIHWFIVHLHWIFTYLGFYSIEH